MDNQQTNGPGCVPIAPLDISCWPPAPAETTSVTCLKLAEILQDAGLPPGVVNFVTGFGELRIRVPVSRSMAIATIALPVGELAREGLVDAVVVQHGQSPAEAAFTQEVMDVAADHVIGAGLRRSGRHYLADSEEGCLLIQVAPHRSKIAIYTLAVTPLGLRADRLQAVLPR